ncbi:MAG: ATP-binding response regulator [Geminicoccaceae bacterium]
MTAREHDAGGNGTRLASDLARENAKLEKINQVLMTRVERSMDMQGSDFTLFEHAILLESKVRERTEELERVLSDLRKSHQELAHAKAEAERANSSKTRFLAAASHDLLQPLNAARLFVAALGETEQTNRNQTLIDNIESAFASVEDLLSDLLEISKLDAGVQRVDLADVPLRSLLVGLAAEFKPLADEKGLAFTVAETDVLLRTDRQLIGRVLRNLIGNAIRYTDQGEVRIEAKAFGTGCRITIVDSGCGIPSDRQEEIFEEFKRFDHAGADAVRGFGLGLAIVQRISRLLDHPIELQSEVGEGARFAILVPMSEQADDQAASGRTSASRPDRTDEAGTVLVIENEAAIRAGMTALLEGWGYLVVTAADASAGLDLLDQHGLTPDLVIADYHLDGGVTGTDAVTGIRTAKGLSFPAMIITADRSPEVQDAVAAEDLSLLTKPVKPARLRALIRHLLGA